MSADLEGNRARLPKPPPFRSIARRITHGIRVFSPKGSILVPVAAPHGKEHAAASFIPELTLMHDQQTDYHSFLVCRQLLTVQVLMLKFGKPTFLRQRTLIRISLPVGMKILMSFSYL